MSPLPDTITATITAEDYHTARVLKQAYCPVAACLSRSYPGQFSPWHVGSFCVAPVLSVADPDGEAVPTYTIPESVQAEIIRPYDGGHFDVNRLPYVMTLTKWRTVE